MSLNVVSIDVAAPNGGGHWGGLGRRTGDRRTRRMVLWVRGRGMAQARPPGSERLGLGTGPRSPREPGREGPDRGQAAGPEPRVTVTLCCWPLASSQVTLTLSP